MKSTDHEATRGPFCFGLRQKRRPRRSGLLKTSWILFLQAAADDRPASRESGARTAFALCLTPIRPRQRSGPHTVPDRSARRAGCPKPPNAALLDEHDRSTRRDHRGRQHTRCSKPERPGCCLVRGRLVTCLGRLAQVCAVANTDRQNRRHKTSYATVFATTLDRFASARSRSNADRARSMTSASRTRRPFFERSDGRPHQPQDQSSARGPAAR
jgi:hypothetical protein